MKLAIFDLDGTLVDSMGIWERLAYDYLNDKGLMVDSNIRESLKEYSLYEASFVIKERFKLEESGEEINRQLEETLRHYYENTIPLKKGVVDFLEYLKKKEIRMIVATATIDSLANSALCRLGIGHYFEFIQTCKAVGIEKYKREFYDLIVERTGVDPKEMVLFEDALHSMEAAKKLGIKVIAIKDDSAKKNLVEIFNIADLVVDDFIDLSLEL